MLEPILQSLRDVAGVQGAMVVDATANIVAHRSHTVYDLPVLQQVARSVLNATDAVQLIQDDWETLTTHFRDGKLVLRSLRTAGAGARRYTLAVIADSGLNLAFLGVALRVAAVKLVAALDAAPEPAAVPPPIPHGRTDRVAVAAARPDMAGSSLVWSGISGRSGVSATGIGAAGIPVADVASSTFLTAAVKAFTVAIGPVAGVLVKETLRTICGERPFARSDGGQLLTQLAAKITAAEARAKFQRATQSLDAG
jgi:predicted regulator of Ras-like GTPase activity (Roadblock/LC7/MglB family)